MHYCRKMKIDRSCPQAVVTEQQLNGPQIRARFQQMSCEAVTQRVRGNRFGESGSHGRSVTDPSDPIARDGISRPISDKEIWVRFVGLPVFPEQLEQFGREHDKAIFAPFTLANGDHLSTAVDVRDEEVGSLRNTQACRIDRRENGLMLKIGSGFKQRMNFSLTENEGQFFDALRIGDEIDHPLAPECLLIEEAQSADCLDQCSPAVFPLLYQVKLVLADVSWCEEVGRLSKVLGKVSHTTEISLNRVQRVSGDLHILNHFLTQCGHRDSF